MVLIDVAHPRLAHLVIDDVCGGELAARHLLAKGQRRIGFVGDPPGSPFGFTTSERRREGFRRALRAAGIEPDSELEQVGPHGLDDARPLAHALLHRDDAPTAIFAASDMQAIGVLQTAEALGLRVPQDVAVIGFDDIEMGDHPGAHHRPAAALGDRRPRCGAAARCHRRRRPPPIEELKPLAVVERRST